MLRNRKTAGTTTNTQHPLLRCDASSGASGAQPGPLGLQAELPGGLQGCPGRQVIDLTVVLLGIPHSYSISKTPTSNTLMDRTSLCVLPMSGCIPQHPKEVSTTAKPLRSPCPHKRRDAMPPPKAQGQTQVTQGDTCQQPMRFLPAPCPSARTGTHTHANSGDAGGVICIEIVCQSPSD